MSNCLLRENDRHDFGVSDRAVRGHHKVDTWGEQGYGTKVKYRCPKRTSTASFHIEAGKAKRQLHPLLYCLIALTRLLEFVTDPFR